MIGNGSFIIDKNGSLWATGYNTSGRLGLGHREQINSFTRVDIDNIEEIISGENVTFIVKSDNTILGSGNSENLGLGSGGTITKFTDLNIKGVKMISCGSSHVFIIKRDSTILTTGYNGYGQLGLGDKENISTFTKVDIENVRKISCGSNHTMLLKKDGTLWSCGSNQYGQLGLGNSGFGTERSVFTKVDVDNIKDVVCGSYHTVILKNDGTVWSCGSNQYGQLGLGIKGSNSYRSIFEKVNIDDVKNIYCGDRGIIIWKNDGTVWGVGSNEYGQLGLGSTTESLVFRDMNISDIKQIECGNNHTVILKNDGTVWGSGHNGNGQLGLGTNILHQKTFTKLRGGSDDNSSLWIRGAESISVLSLLLYHSDKYFKLNDNRMIEEVSILTGDDFAIHGMNKMIDLTIPDINGNRPIDLLPDEFEIRTWESNPKNISIEVIEPSYKPIDDLEDTFEILAYSDEEYDKQLNVKALPKENQLIIPTGDIDIRHIEGMDRCYVRESENSGSVKIICSTDSGNTWKSFKNGNWINVELNKESVSLNGLTPNELGEITREKWDLITESRLIRFAYLITKNSIDSTYGIDKLELVVEMKGIWDKAIHGVDYRYRYPNNYLLKVELKTDGTYKINYGD